MAPIFPLTRPGAQPGDGGYHGVGAYGGGAGGFVL